MNASDRGDGYRFELENSIVEVSSVAARSERAEIASRRKIHSATQEARDRNRPDICSERQPSAPTDCLSIDRIRSFASVQHPPGSPARWIAERLAEYLAAKGHLTLDDAFHVRPERGNWPWWRIEQRECERAAARRLVDAFDGIVADAYHALCRFADGRGRHPHREFHDRRTQALQEFLHVFGRVPADVRPLAAAAATSSPISLQSGRGPISLEADDPGARTDPGT
ncbi:MAG: hypothetical protein AB7Q97_12450 [Gammaproteobacteria bacterium]